MEGKKKKTQIDIVKWQFETGKWHLKPWNGKQKKLELKCVI